MGHLRRECLGRDRSWTSIPMEVSSAEVGDLAFGFTFHGNNDSRPSAAMAFNPLDSSFLGKLKSLSPSLFNSLNSEELKDLKDWDLGGLQAHSIDSGHLSFIKEEMENLSVGDILSNLIGYGNFVGHTRLESVEDLKDDMFGPLEKF